MYVLTSRERVEVGLRHPYETGYETGYRQEGRSVRIQRVAPFIMPGLLRTRRIKCRSRYKNIPTMPVGTADLATLPLHVRCRRIPRCSGFVTSGAPFTTSTRLIWSCSDCPSVKANKFEIQRQCPSRVSSLSPSCTTRQQGPDTPHEVILVQMGRALSPPFRRAPRATAAARSACTRALQPSELLVPPRLEHALRRRRRRRAQQRPLLAERAHVLLPLRRRQPRERARAGGEQHEQRAPAAAAPERALAEGFVVQLRRLWGEAGGVTARRVKVARATQSEQSSRKVGRGCE
jgi:hypothetical protein